MNSAVKLRRDHTYSMSASFPPEYIPSEKDVFEIRNLATIPDAKSEATGSKLDLAVSGRGFLLLRNPQTGQSLVARSGSFRNNTTGSEDNLVQPYLVNEKGYRLQGAIGATHRVFFDPTKIVPPRLQPGDLGYVNAISTKFQASGYTGSEGGETLTLEATPPPDQTPAPGAPLSGPGIPSGTFILETTAGFVTLSKPLTRRISVGEAVSIGSKSLDSASEQIKVAPDYQRPDLAEGQYLISAMLPERTQIVKVAGEHVRGIIPASETAKTLDQTLPSIDLPEATANSMEVGAPISIEGFSSIAFVKAKGIASGGIVRVRLGTLGGHTAIYGEDVFPESDAWSAVRFSYGLQTATLNQRAFSDSYSTIPLVLSSVYTPPAPNPAACRVAGPADNTRITVLAASFVTSGWSAAAGSSTLVGGDAGPLKVGMRISGQGLPRDTTIVASASGLLSLNQPVTETLAASTKLTAQKPSVDAQSNELRLPPDYTRPDSLPGTAISGPQFEPGTWIAASSGNIKKAIPAALRPLSVSLAATGLLDGSLTLTAPSARDANELRVGMLVSDPGGTLDGLVLQTVTQTEDLEKLLVTLCRSSGEAFEPSETDALNVQIREAKTLDKTFPGVRLPNASGITPGMAVSGENIPPDTLVKGIGEVGFDGRRTVFLGKAGSLVW